MSKSPKKPASNLVECQICHEYYQLKGIGRHRIACAREHNSEAQQKDFLKKKAKESKIPKGNISSFFFTQQMFCDYIWYLEKIIIPRRLVVKPWENLGRLGDLIIMLFLKFTL